MNKIKYNYNTYKIDLLDFTQVLNQGQENSIKIKLEFNVPIKLEWQVWVAFERPDGSKSTNMLATRNGDHYLITIGSWFTDIAGIGKIHTRIKVSGEEIASFSKAQVIIYDGVDPIGTTIDEEEYNYLSNTINGVNGKIEAHIENKNNPHNVTAEQLNVYEKPHVNNIANRVSVVESNITRIDIKNEQQDANILELNEGLVSLDDDKIEQTALDGFVFEPTWDKDNHILTLNIQGYPPLVIDLPSEYAFHNIRVEGDDLILTREDGTEVVVSSSGLLDNKVDKVSGKGLSTNDFTNALKTKLDGLDTQTELDNKFDDKANNTDLAQVYGGKNIGLDLTNKEYLGNGEYHLHETGGLIVTYNVFNGIYNINGTSNSILNFISILYNEISVSTVKLYHVSGSTNNPIYPAGSFRYPNNPNVDVFNQNLILGFNNSSISNQFVLWTDKNVTFNNYQFKLQIEKGSTATPYTLPLWITPEYIRQTQTPRLIYSNSGTSSGTDITFSYIDNTMKVGDVYKVHSQLTYDNSELTQREVNELIISDTVNNNIEKNHYTQTQHSAITKVNYDYTTKTITMIGDFNAGDSSNSFNIRLYKVGY